MKDEIIIRLDDIDKFVVEGGKFVMKPEAERSILNLLKAREDIMTMLDNKIEEVKSKIMEAGESISPNFKGVVGNRLSVQCRMYGDKFKYDKALVGQARPFLKEVKFFKPDAAKVEDYIEKNHKLPEGITESDRKKVINFIVKDKLLEK